MLKLLFKDGKTQDRIFYLYYSLLEFPVCSWQSSHLPIKKVPIVYFRDIMKKNKGRKFLRGLDRGIYSSEFKAKETRNERKEMINLLLSPPSYSNVLELLGYYEY